MDRTVPGNIPLWSIACPAVSAVLVGLIFTHIIPESAVVLVLSAVALGACVFAAVHHAEILALKVGEPLGSIILAAAVTIIEVGLIASIMLSGAEGSEMVARDTVFSAIMIVLNGVIGLTLVVGASRHHEQAFQVSATSAALGVLGTLATIVFILPDFANPGASMQFSTIQLTVAGLVCLVLYGFFVFVQTIRHRDYFMEVEASGAGGEEMLHHHTPSRKETLVSTALLPLSLLFVILLSKVLSHPLDDAVAAAGLPQAVVGIVIAAVVLLPEGIASVRAALLNRLQNSVNLILGSALASIGMTIPVVATLAIFTGMPLTLGLEPSSIVLLLLTMFVSTLTLGTGRTTTLHGAIHLGIFVMFVLISTMP